MQKRSHNLKKRHIYKLKIVRSKFAAKSLEEQRLPLASYLGLSVEVNIEGMQATQCLIDI